MFPGGPGIPSAPLRPGRPGGPWKETEEEGHGETPTCGGLTHTANRGQSSPAPRGLLEVLLVLWLLEALAPPAHTDEKHKKPAEFDGTASPHLHKSHRSCTCVRLSHITKPFFLTWTPKKNVFQVTRHAADFTNLWSCRPVWSCNLRSLQKFHRNELVWCNKIYTEWDF